VRTVAIACGGLILLALFAIVAAIVLAPTGITGITGITGMAAHGCAPAPCADIRGFELRISHVSRAASAGQGGDPAGSARVVTMRAAFRNNFASTPLDANDDLRADPADVKLRDARGQEHDAVFSAAPGCARWQAVTLPKGATLGPQPLCFEVADNARGALTLIWSPDVGPFVPPAAIPLPAVSSS